MSHLRRSVNARTDRQEFYESLRHLPMNRDTSNRVAYWAGYNEIPLREIVDEIGDYYRATSGIREFLRKEFLL